MTISAHLTTFAGMPVQDWRPDAGPIEPAVCYRVALDYDEAEAGDAWTDRFAALHDHPNSAALSGLVVGSWGTMFDEQQNDAARAVEAIVAARAQLPGLRALFFGDITSEECEISWIVNTDVSPLLDAYPALEHFAVRGATNLRLGTLRHSQLRTLTIECGGMDGAIARAVAAADLPQLQHLELWLGTENYGGTTTIEDIAPILGGALFPKLRYLGLRDSDIADELAIAAATAPVLQRIRVLDLSLGTLGDVGVAALLVSPAVARLEKLDIHHHFCSGEMVARLQALGTAVDTSEPQQEESYNGEVWRYVAVGE